MAFSECGLWPAAPRRAQKPQNISFETGSWLSENLTVTIDN